MRGRQGNAKNVKNITNCNCVVLSHFSGLLAYFLAMNVQTRICV